MLVVNKDQGNPLTILMSGGKTCSSSRFRELLDAGSVGSPKGILDVKQ